MATTELLPEIEPGANIQSDALYSRTLESGEVVTANSVQEVLKKCPALAWIAINNPEMAEILAESSLTGHQIMESEQTVTIEEVPITSPIRVKEAVSNTIPQKPADSTLPVQEIKPKSIVTLEPQPTESVPVAIQKEIVEKSTHVQSFPKLSRLISRHTLSRTSASNIESANQVQHAHTGKRPTASHIRPSKSPLSQEVPNFVDPTQETPTVIVSPISSMGIEAAAKLAVILPKPDVFVPSIQFSETHVAVDESEALADIDTVGDSTETVDTFVELPEMPVHEVLQIDIQETVQYTPETIETYTQLVLITFQEKIDVFPQTVLSESKWYAPEVQVEPAPVIADIVDFDSIIQQVNENEAFNPVSEIPPPNNQPLEQTLAQLTYVFAEQFAETEQSVLHKTLADIETIITRSLENAEPENIQNVLSAELTSAILVLLQQMGYEQPSETLLTFVHSYGFDALLQTIRYLHQLQSPENRQEFIATLAARKLLANNDTRTRVGKLLFALVHSVTQPQFTVISR